MTISYTQEVATCTGFGCFIKLLARWRGSIYKLLWQDLLVFLSSYYILSLTYRFLLNEGDKFVFESIVYYCNNNGSLIPLSFVLGFYVTLVMTRWWDQYLSIPWPDPLAVYVSALVRGQDDRGRLMRRTVMRYVCLTLTMVFTMIAPEVKKRFPTLDHLVEAGLLLDNEKLILNSLDEKFAKHARHWIPIVWAGSIITRARKEGRIWDDFSLKTIIDELNKFRGKCNLLLHYDFISIPLVYTQVVTLTVYTYFLSAVIGKQWTDKMDKNGYWNIIGYYFPVFSTLEFFFYMGWMKVAESLINPFGPDDDDFEVNEIIDRNLQVSYLIVDEMHHAHPELVKDQYWDEVFPASLPYPINFVNERNDPPLQSTAKLDFKHITPTPSTVKFTAESKFLNKPSFAAHNKTGLEHSFSSAHLLSKARQTHASDSSSLNTDSEAKVTELMSDDRLPRRTTEEDKIPYTASVLFPRTSFHITSETESEHENDIDRPEDDDIQHPEHDDDFDRLKEEREKQRSERFRLHLAQSISKVADVVADMIRPHTQDETTQSSQQAPDKDTDSSENIHNDEK